MIPSPSGWLLNRVEIENPSSNHLISDTSSPRFAPFCNQVVATEGDIFEKCIASWSQFRLFLLEAPYDVAVKLERHIMLTITMKIISKVMSDLASVGIRND